MSSEIIPAPMTPQRVRRVYDFASRFYDYVTRYERGPKKRGLQIANIKKGHVVLEVGFGTGRTLLAIARKVGGAGRVYGIDISQRMVEKAERLVNRHGLSQRVNLMQGDARKLPFDEGMFDVVFNSYMLDLIDTPEIPTVLLEFKRILRPGGRLVLVNLTKGRGWSSSMKIYEGVYKLLPLCLGGCRPVLTKPFLESLRYQNIGREFVLAGHLMPTEIVWGEKPSKVSL